MAQNYQQKLDAYGNPIKEGIKGLKVISKTFNAVGRENILIEKDSEGNEPYGVLFNVVPNDLKCKVKVNNNDFITVLGSGTMFSPFIDNVDSLEVDIQQTSAEPLEIVLIY